MGKHGDRSMTTQLKVLLPGSFEKKLRISDELAECFDSRGGGARMTALLVSPFGSDVWRIEVCRDADGAFLGRSWPDFVEAHGISVGWFLVLRHIVRGVLTVKAFDGTCLIKEFGQTITVPGLPAAPIETGRARKPQFIRPLLHDWMEKMPIPVEFLKRRYISDEELNRRMATFVTPFRDFCHIHLEKDGPNVFFAGDWSKFLEFQGITQGEALLIRYQGNMIFTIEVFGCTGCGRKLKKQGIRFQQTENSENTNSSQETEQSEDENSSQENGQNKEGNSSQETESEEANSPQGSVQSEEAYSTEKTAPSSADVHNQKETHISSRKRKRSDEKRVPTSSKNPLDKKARTYCEYGIEPQPWLRKQLNTYALKRFLPLPGSFCKKVGFLENCKITLKSSERNRSWEVDGVVYGTGHWNLSHGWMIFCRDNGLKAGDMCTFNIVNSNLWRVDIEPC